MPASPEGAYDTAPTQFGPVSGEEEDLFHDFLRDAARRTGSMEVGSECRGSSLSKGHPVSVEAAAAATREPAGLRVVPEFVGQSKDLKPLLSTAPAPNARRVWWRASPDRSGHEASPRRFRGDQGQKPHYDPQSMPEQQLRRARVLTRVHATKCNAIFGLRRARHRRRVSTKTTNVDERPQPGAVPSPRPAGSCRVRRIRRAIRRFRRTGAVHLTLVSGVGRFVGQGLRRDVAPGRGDAPRFRSVPGGRTGESHLRS